MADERLGSMAHNCVCTCPRAALCCSLNIEEQHEVVVNCPSQSTAQGQIKGLKWMRLRFGAALPSYNCALSLVKSSQQKRSKNRDSKIKIYLLYQYLIHRSLRLSLTDFSKGLRRYSITRRWPVLISTVTAMPGDRLTCLPSIWMVDRSMLTRVG
jgi:hypothetical protein